MLNNNENNFYQEQYNAGMRIEPQPYMPAPQPQRKQPKKKQLTVRKVAAVALAFGVTGGVLGAGGTLLGTGYFNSDKSTEDSSSRSANIVYATGDKSSSDESSGKATETKSGTRTLKTPSEVYAENVNSTVGITTEMTTNYFGYTTTAAAAGSGFILTEDGYIVTNYHVIEGANSVKVALYDGTEYDAEIIGGDESNDIAVLKINAEGLTPVTIGSSDELMVGESVAAIGNPLGELTFSFTTGVVSALDRSVTTESTTMDLIQTDCAINAGNSGGALFNMYGEVIGITNAKYSSNSLGEASIDNIGFAIPIDNVIGIIESIIEKGYVVKPYIGVTVATVSDQSVSLGIPKGALVDSVVSGGPAEQAGLKENDVIYEADGTKIESKEDLVNFVKKLSAGDKITLKVYSQGEDKEIVVTVGETKTDTAVNTETDGGNNGEEPSDRSGQEFHDFFNDENNGFGNFDEYQEFQDFFNNGQW
ncbi:MAG: trypsin-like peptidase domain-containing protein [Ruminococcus sp.]|nr:trypsin-like peptidase domain-containing protein [Ruminococcus sp.]